MTRSEKVKLPFKVAEALKELHVSVGSQGILSGVLGSSNTKPFLIIKEFVKPVGGFAVLLECLVNGYEVAETPEEKVRNYFENHAEKVGNGKTVVLNVLHLLNIQIEGVNA